MSFDALLDAITDGPDDASLAGLRAHLDRRTDPRSRQRLRFLALRAARVLEHRKAPEAARRLTDLALGPARDSDWLFDDAALEVVPPAPDAGLVRFTVVDPAAAPIDPAIAAELEELDRTGIGPDLEPKYRIVSLRRDDHGHLDITASTATWTTGRLFHRTLLAEPWRLRHGADGGWVAPVPLGAAILPGITSVHAVVQTADDRLMISQRPADAAYGPGHWSLAFEEQLTTVDLGPGIDPFAVAASRGMAEEFSCPVDPARATVLTAIVEVDFCNVAVVVLLRPPLTAEQIRRAWAAGADHAGDRATDIEFVGADDAAALARFTPLHRTSPLRWAAFSRWQRHQAATGMSSTR